MKLELIQEFDIFLHNRGEYFQGVVIGGAALIIMNITSRVTKDVDFLDPEIPENIKLASVEFSKLQPSWGLKEDWFNNGPASLKLELPVGWSDRLEIVYRGRSLVFQTLGRSDLLKSKLFAYCDRTEPDFQDLLKMRPSKEEISDAAEWVKCRDGNPLWPERVDLAFLELRKALGYE